MSPKVSYLPIGEKVLSVVDKGLSSGVGKPVPGHMCVEAAVCYAMGEEHSDRPSCVKKCVRSFKITVNDLPIWKTRKERARFLRRIAVAQLGSIDIDSQRFNDTLSKNLTLRFLPLFIEEVLVKGTKNKELRDKLLSICEKMRKGMMNPDDVKKWVYNNVEEHSLRYDLEDVSNCFLACGVYTNLGDLLEMCLKTRFKKYAKHKKKVRSQLIHTFLECAIDTLRHLKVPGVKVMDKLTKRPASAK